MNNILIVETGTGIVFDRTTLNSVDTPSKAQKRKRRHYYFLYVQSKIFTAWKVSVETKYKKWRRCPQKTLSLKYALELFFGKSGKISARKYPMWKNPFCSKKFLWLKASELVGTIWSRLLPWMAKTVQKVILSCNSLNYSKSYIN